MKKQKIDKKIILERIDIIQKSLKKLEGLKSLTPGKFMLDENFAIAEHYLRYALEATFDICAHILSKIPGARIGSYAEMAEDMGRQELLPRTFVGEKFIEMVRCRNRLTHFYLEVTPKEMYSIIQNDLGDFEIFMKHIKKVIMDQKNNKSIN